jgi:hypothetical protein
LEQYGIFVSETTLEIDVLPYCVDAMKAVYREFGVRSDAQLRFEKALDFASTGDPNAGKFVLDRMNEKTKGRFAQRLAAKVETDVNQCPPHIQRCIQHINGQVNPPLKDSSETLEF